MDAAWRDGAGAQASPLEHAWQARGADPRTAAGQTALENTLATAWRDAMDGKEVDMDSVWARAMDEAKAGADANLAGLQEAWRQAGGGEADALEDAWGDALAQQASAEISQIRDVAEVPYAFAEEDNPYAADDDAFAKGLAAFKEGRLVDAVRAFEAVVQREPAHSPSNVRGTHNARGHCMHL